MVYIYQCRGVNILKSIWKLVLFAFGVWLLPWVWWPWARVPFELPKVWFFQIWVAIMSGTALITVIKNHQFPRFRSALLLPILSFWLWVIITSVWGSDWPKSWWGNYYRGDGLLTLTGLMGMTLLISWWSIRVERVIQVLSWASISITMGTMLLWLYVRTGGPLTGWWNSWMWDGSVGLTFGNPHFLAGYLVVTLPAVLTQVGTTKGVSRFWWVVATALCQIAIAVTGSYLSVGMIGAVWLVWLGIQRPRWRWVTIGIMALFFGVIGWWIWKPSITFNAQSRERIWYRISMGVQQRPLIGYGWANVDHAIENMVWPYPVRFDVYIDKAHSSIMEVLASTGVIGLGLYGWLWITVIRETKCYLADNQGKDRRLRQGLVSVLFVWFIQSQLNVLSISTEVIGWMVAGVLFTCGTTFDTCPEK